MGKLRGIFLTYVLLLAITLAGENLSAEARWAEWRVPSTTNSTKLSNGLANPTNLSGNSARELFEQPAETSVRVGDGAIRTSAPMNLSNNIVVPTTLSGNSAGELFEQPAETLVGRGNGAFRTSAPMNLSNNIVAPNNLSNNIVATMNLSNNIVAPMNLSNNIVVPTNLSGNSAGELFEQPAETLVGRGNGAFRTSAPMNLSNNIVAPMNLSNNIVVPTNLSGNSAGELFEQPAETLVGRGNGAFRTSAPMNLSNNIVAPMNLSNNIVAPMNLSNNIAAPMNLSNNIVVPTNLSGNSAGERFELPGESARGHLFDVVNNLPAGEGIEMQCVNHNVQYPAYVVDVHISSGQSYHWDLQNLYPDNISRQYRCNWVWVGKHPVKHIDQEIWADQNNQHLMPFYCTDCNLALYEDGMYVYNIHVQHFVKLEDWTR